MYEFLTKSDTSRVLAVKTKFYHIYITTILTFATMY